MGGHVWRGGGGVGVRVEEGGVRAIEAKGKQPVVKGWSWRVMDQVCISLDSMFVWQVEQVCKIA